MSASIEHRLNVNVLYVLLADISHNWPHMLAAS